MWWDKIFLILVILVAGCVSETPTTDTLQIEMGADQYKIFSGGSDVFYARFVNNAGKDYKNLKFSVFDAPFFEGTCEKTADHLPAKSENELYCEIKSTPVNENVKSSVSMAAIFSGTQSIYQIIETISQEEYFRNKIPKKPQDYTYSDGYIEVDVHFQDELPIVYIPGREYIVTFTVKNVGSGTVEDMKISLDKKGVVGECNPEPSEIKYNGEREITFGCKLVPPEAKVLNVSGVILNVDYTYKVIKTVDISIVR